MGGPAQGLFQYGDELVEFHSLVIADIIDAPGRGTRGRVGRGGVEGRVGRGNQGQQADHAFHDVIDIGEVAAHAALVEDLDGFAPHNGRGKEMQGHVRAAPGAVDREKAQARAGQAVEVAVGMGHEFVALLGGRVQAHRMVHVMVHGIGAGGVEAVDRGG